MPSMGIIVLIAIMIVLSLSQSSIALPNQSPGWIGSESTAVIETIDGPVAGWSWDGVNHYANIPFAKPPIGDLRFRSPEPPVRWNDTRQFMGPVLPICPQMKISEHFFVGEEDCLYLDVYVPSTWKSGDPLLPVMFFIYGGAYIIGDKYEFGWYDGHNFVRNTQGKNNFILVTSNYRLAAFGFMALDGLRAENTDGSTGNYALQDQRLAMKWVQSNIAKFGGDPKRVTIFGESAGAFSVCSHLVMPASWGLFSAAISESGGCEWAHNYTTSRSISEAFSASIGCDPASANVIACLRALPTSAILGDVSTSSSMNARGNGEQTWPSSTPLSAFHSMGVPSLLKDLPIKPIAPFYPTIDNATTGLSGRPIDLIEAGRWSRVPVIAGTNRDEYGLFILGVPFYPNLSVTLPMNWVTLNKTLTYIWGNNVMKDIFQIYPQQQYKSADALFVSVATDFQFMCPTRRMLRAMSLTSANNVPLYQYLFNYAPKWLDVDILGVYHTLELDFVFGNAWPPILHTFGVAEMRMVTLIQTLWTNFATSNSPVKPVAVAPNGWPTYTWNGTRQSIILDEPSASVANNLRSAQCNYWDAHFT